MKYQFDAFTLDCDLAELSQNGKVLATEPRVFDLLVLLVENRQRVVFKDEIIEHIWAGRFTSDASIATCIKSLRKTLNDTGVDQQYIKTVRGKGFRFVGTLQTTPPEPDPVKPRIKSSAANSVAHEPLINVARLQGKPSIIVLPLQNLSLGAGRGSDTEIVAEALSHELIQALSRLGWLRVIARGTAFQFQAAQVDLPGLADQLHLRYALCGAIQTVGDCHVVTVELNDCISNDVVWAERFEVKLAQIHELRHTILTSVIASLETYIPLHEASIASVQTPDSIDAWANYHLGLRHMFRFTQADNLRAAVHFDKALVQDPNFARALAGKSFTRFQDAFLNYSNDQNVARLDARRFAERAVELDPLDPFTNYNLGRSFWLSDHIMLGLPWLERAIQLSPNFAQGYYSCAFIEVMQSTPECALENTDHALNLSPLDPLGYAMLSVRALACVRNGELIQAINWAEKAAQFPNSHFLILMITAAVAALAENPERARYWALQTRRANGRAAQSHFFAAFPISDEPFRQAMTKGLVMAGFD